MVQYPKPMGVFWKFGHSLQGTITYLFAAGTHKSRWFPTFPFGGICDRFLEGTSHGSFLMPLEVEHWKTRWNPNVTFMFFGSNRSPWRVFSSIGKDEERSTVLLSVSFSFSHDTQGFFGSQIWTNHLRLTFSKPKRSRRGEMIWCLSHRIHGKWYVYLLTNLPNKMINHSLSKYTIHGSYGYWSTGCLFIVWNVASPKQQ